MSATWTCPTCQMLIHLQHVDTAADGEWIVDLHDAIGLHIGNCG